MTDLDLTFIGTGNAFAPGGLCWNGFLVDRRHLFEAPPQALQALNRLGIDPNTIETLVLSHQHGDHFLGLPFLLLHWQWMDRTTPIRIVAPEGTREAMLQMCQIAYPGVTDAPFGVEWIDAPAGQSLHVGDLVLEAVEVKHDPRLQHSLGFRASFAGHRFGYTGDSAMCDAVLDLARDSEVLISECSSRAEQLPVHMNLVDDIPVVRNAMRPDASLVLTHLGPGIDVQALPRTTIARDLASYKFG